MAALSIHISLAHINKKHYHPHLQIHQKPKLSIRSESPSPTTDEPQKKPNSQGLGFGSSTSNNPNSTTKSGKKERSVIRRRTPIENPGFGSVKQQAKKEQEQQQQGVNESAFLLTWSGLGIVIFIEGIALSISGFLPEEWDKLFVKYVYPSFTPTIGLFLAGTVVYGVTKYLQNEELKGK